mgnify:CR=1 FL=1
MAKLSKNQLRAKMQANSPSKTPKAVPLTDLAGAKPNAPIIKGVPKRTRAKDGNKTTRRYSFEITSELIDRLDQAIANYRKTTGKNISNSAVIRTALDKYLKGGKL